jgi:vacuolar-type H+-ATPase subunit I/STV1
MAKETAMATEADAIKDVAREINELGDIGKEVDNLKRALEALKDEVKDLKNFRPLTDRLDKTNEHLGKIVEELRKTREK